MHNTFLSIARTSTGGCEGTQAWPKGATQRPRSGAEAEGTPCPRGGSQEELPHIQGVVAAWVQEGLEELFHIQDQEGRQ